jgi:hypothetical protein
MQRANIRMNLIPGQGNPAPRISQRPQLAQVLYTAEFAKQLSVVSCQLSEKCLLTQLTQLTQLTN